MDVWKLRVPENFLPERNYTADCIFKEFLGVQYEFVPDASLHNSYLLNINHKQIEFADSFFGGKNEHIGYLDASNIPGDVKFHKNHFTGSEDIVLFFGNADCRIEEEKIYCGNDLVASIFFMLSRWEEAVIDKKDYLDRFPAEESLATKGNFLHRPVVNEWLTMLKKMMLHLEPETRFNPPGKFEIVFTHDIDLLSKPVSLREFAKDILKRKSIRAFATRASYSVGKNNPYNLFDYFMDVSESQGAVSRFYFMTGHNIPYRDGENYNRTPLYKMALRKILERGHVVGFHPSLLTYNNADMFRKEKELLEKNCGRSVTEGRQHALRFSMPETWRIWNDNGMQLDTTLGYSAREGFRCGTGNTYTTFDAKKREHLKLREMPLVVMDTTLHVNRKFGIEESEKTFINYIEEGKKHNMPITLLFHNLIHDKIDWPGWEHLYEKMFGQKSQMH